MAITSRRLDAVRSAAGALAPAAAASPRWGAWRQRAGTILPQIGWTLLSVGLFASIWEFLWLVGWADPKLLPPPHIFLSDFADQAANFNTAQRWQIGTDASAGPTPTQAVFITIASTTMRVFAGLILASICAITIGVAIRYWRLFGNLTLPTVTLLAPVSPVAWLPVAIFLFGIGDAPAIFMVFIALFFTMTLATITQIDSVNRNYLNVARTMGATKRQTYTRVILPAILPGFLVVLRLNLFAAWMVVLIAEATGVGYGLGQVIMLARNTFNPGLVFFTIVLIGITGFLFDYALRTVQRRVLFWLPPGSQGGLAGG